MIYKRETRDTKRTGISMQEKVGKPLAIEHDELMIGMGKTYNTVRWERANVRNSKRLC
jgi:hypothetical protein